MIVYTEDEINAAALAYFRVTFQNSATPIDLSDRSFCGLHARAFARFWVLAQSQILQANNDAIPAYQQDADGNLRSKTSRAALEAWAFVFGLPSDVAGVYGAKGPTISTGASGRAARSSNPHSGRGSRKCCRHHWRLPSGPTHQVTVGVHFFTLPVSRSVMSARST